MAATSNMESLGVRYAPYIEELHEFFETHGLHHGNPEDLITLSQRLAEPGEFPLQLSSMVRSIIYREHGGLPRAELLEVIAIAIAGQGVEQSAQEVHEPMRQILFFLGKVARAPMNVPPADVVPASTDGPISASHVVADPARLAAAEAAAAAEARTTERQRYVPVAPEAKVQQEFEGSDAPIRRMGRNTWIAAAAAVLALVVVAVALFWRPAASVSNQAADASINTPVGTATAAPDPSLPPKPSAATTPAGGIAGTSGRDQIATRPALASADQAAASGGLPANQSQSGASQVNTGATAPAASAPPVSPAASVAVPAGPEASPAPYGSSAGSARSSGKIRPLKPGRTSGTFTVSSGVMASHLISAPAPKYPKLASLTHIEGQVILQAVIGKDGRVAVVHALRGHHLLRGAASDAVRQWRYRPYVDEGRPVEVATIVTVNFQLHR